MSEKKETVDQTTTDDTGNSSTQKSSTEKRINKLVAQREYWRGKAEARGQEITEPKPKPAPAPKELDPNDFNSDSEYRSALKEQIREELKAEIKEPKLPAAATKYQTQVVEARTKYDDFDEVALDPTLPVTREMFEALQGEKATDILYALGQNPEEANRIATLSPFEQAKEIGKIELRLSKKEKNISSAPEPPKTLRGSDQIVPTKPVEDMDRSERISKWEQDRRERIKKQYG